MKLDCLVSVVLIAVLGFSAFALASTDIDSYLLEGGLTQQEIDSLTNLEKETLYQSTELRNDIDMDVVETFLIERGTPNDVMDSLNSGQKISIYESLISQDDYEDFLFNKL